MARPDKKAMLASGAVFLAVAAAYSVKVCSSLLVRSETVSHIAELLRSGIYIALFAAWGVSVRRRVIQPQVRGYLSAISALFVFWMAVRTAKYLIFNNPHICRYLWYFYYLPQILISLMLVFTACSLGKPEKYRLPKWTNALYAVSGILLLLILTNDIHELAFGFPNGPSHIESGAYTHGIVYFLTMGWIILCVLTMLVMLYCKCRVPGSKKRIWRPCIPILVMVAYWAMYLFALPVLKRFYLRDMTVTSGLLCVAMLESCILCGLIRSNKGYGELFCHSGIGAILADDDYHIVLSSDGATPSDELMRQTEKSPVLLGGDLRLSGAPIKGGHVLWTEDVSELTSVLEKLSDHKEDLKEETALLRENYDTEVRISQLTEKNRLYDEIHRKTAPQIILLGELIGQLETTYDEAEKKRLLQKMVVIGVYLKRRSNLIFISEQNNALPVKELSLCFEETMENLKLSGVFCGYYVAFSHDMTTDTATALYDFAEHVIEAAYDTLHSLLIRIFETSESTAIGIELSCNADLTDFASDRISLSHDEDGTVCLVLRIPKGDVEK